MSPVPPPKDEQPTETAQQPMSPSEPLPGNAEPSEGAGTGVRVSVLESRLANQGNDIPDLGREAKPRKRSDEFPDLAYPPQIDKMALGQEFIVYVMVNATGKPEHIQVRQGSQSPAYKQWVEELIAQWEFEPAYQGGQPVAGELEVTVRIDPL